MKRVELLPNIITAFGLSCGLFVLFRMNMTGLGEVTPHLLNVMSGILLLAAFADLLDGAIARIMKAESDFGGIFDSLSDAITFGVVPSVMILKTLSSLPDAEHAFFLMASAMIFSVCGVLRLARFNVMSLRAKTDQGLLDANKKNFTGLPIPAGAIAAVSCNLFLVSEEFRSLITLDDTTRAWVMAFVLIVLGFFMISRWKFPSLKTLQIRVKSFQLVMLTVISAIIFFYGVLHHFPVMFFCISWTYVVVAWILSLIRLISGKKSKTLEDFEPEPDELDNEF